MSDGDAPRGRSSQQTDEPEVGRRAGDGEAATSNEASDKELLCTICGLTACWQSPAAAEGTG